MDFQDIPKIFNKKIEACNLCLKNSYDIEALTILYSSIDALSWLNSSNIDIKKGRSVGNEYNSYLNKYFMKHLNTYNITSNEIYSARCSILHTNSSTSKSTSKKCRRLVYCNSKKGKELQSFILKKINENAVAVNIEDLIVALKFSIDDFIDEKSHASSIVIQKIENKLNDYYVDLLENVDNYN